MTTQINTKLQYLIIFIAVFCLFPPLTHSALLSYCGIILFENGKPITDNSVIYSNAPDSYTVCEHGTCTPLECGKGTFIKTTSTNILTYKEWREIEIDKAGCHSTGYNPKKKCDIDNFGYNNYKTYLLPFLRNPEYSVTFDFPKNKHRIPKIKYEREGLITQESIKADLKTGKFVVYDQEKSAWPSDLNWFVASPSYAATPQFQMNGQEKNDTQTDGMRNLKTRNVIVHNDKSTVISILWMHYYIYILAGVAILAIVVSLLRVAHIRNSKESHDTTKK